MRHLIELLLKIRNSEEVALLGGTVQTMFQSLCLGFQRKIYFG